MTTEEKLFVLIFERKNWIIEQVRQQTDFYIQNLASKLLIDGITPPPWLWNPSSHSQSSEPKDGGESGMSAHGLIDLQCADDNCASFSGQTEVQFAKSSLSCKLKMNPTKAESWPQSKRRKVEDELFNGFSASSSLRIQMPCNIQRGSTCRYLENIGSTSDSGQELQVLSLSAEGKLSRPNANKSSDVGSYHEIQHPMTSDIDFSPSLQVKEVEFGSEVNNKTVGTPFTFNDHQSRPSYLQSLTKKAAAGSTYCLGESMETELGDVSNLCPEYRVNVVNADNLTAERNFPKRISHVTGDGLLLHYSAWSPHNDQDLVGPDETMPVFEGFIIDGHTENAGELNMNTLDIPSTSSEHTRISCSGTPFGWNSRSHYASPLEKLWERFSSSSGSSKKRSTSNPELTCFPIEEDPSANEENENAEEADEIQQDTVSNGLNDSAKRQPLVEITEACLDPVQSISAAEKLPNRHSTKRGIKSLQSRISKPKLSGKTSLRKGVDILSQKEPKVNNIVTGLTSFIPLVQQKQAAAVCPAKRDIKVKALEAAEAAKRLEEKRENERKMRKEAMKIERARIEKENLREIEINKKKKQEEKKKRDADIAARKRLREEEERKEKNKRRKRVAEGRLEQKLADEKFRTGKAEKDKHGKMDEKVIRGKEPDPTLEKKKNSVNEGGDENYFKKANTDPQANYVFEDPDAASSCDNDGEQMSTLEKTAERNDLATVRSQEISYDISPYQCSDDEEEDGIPTTKYIPSWASVDFDLALQNKLDPDVIFPRESFCNMNEVLLPRRLQGRI